VVGALECRILRRVNRFVVEVIAAGTVARAFINNTGRLSEYLAPGRRGFCLRNPPGRRTEYRLFAVEDSGLAALIDTQMQMKAFEEALERGLIPWLRECRVAKRNVRLGDSLIDYLLECRGCTMYLEVKSAVLRGDSRYAMYPDCPTERGRRHIRALIEHARAGGCAALLFIAALPHVETFRAYAQGDPEIPLLIRDAAGSGVLVKALAMHYDPVSSTVCLDNADLRVEL